MPDLPLLQSCDGCGACCRHMIVPPFRMAGGRNEAREKGVPPELIAEFLPLWNVRLETAAAVCLWFDETTLRCRHYELRPDACREFEINSGSCRECRAAFGIQ